MIRIRDCKSRTAGHNFIRNSSKIINMTTENKILLGVLLLSSISCTINQKIAYSTNEIKIKPSPTTSNLVLSIDLLEDNRKSEVENSILFQNPRQFRYNGEMICINSEEHYVDKKEPINQQITFALIKHLRAEKQFKGVRYAKRDSIDYYITGKIANFYSKQGFSNEAAAGAQLGLISALETMEVKTEGLIKITFSDLKIYDKKGELMKEIGTIEKKFEESLSAEAYCWCSYFNVNDKFKGHL